MKTKTLITLLLTTALMADIATAGEHNTAGKAYTATGEEYAAREGYAAEEEYAAGEEYTLRGKVLQATDGAPVEMATVRLFRYEQKDGRTDSVLVKGGQTDMNGGYVLEKVAAGSYGIVVSSIGFIQEKITVRVPGKKNETSVQVKAISLKEDVQALATVDVKGSAAEMTVKGDTIEYNTAAYKVQDGAMVEDLLKKMNGVEVDKEGKVTVNGETITAVRIDGKKFFGSDVQSATKNIPAEMIDKIQVVDEKSDMAKLTGFEDDETERIINLSLKKDRKKGVFGNYAGGIGADLVTDNGKWFDYGNKEFGATAGERTKHFFGNDFRYNANLFTNILLGESQTTILGSANNTNSIRSGRGRGSFGVQNQGITWGENIGVNTNIDLTKKLVRPRVSASLLLGGDGQFGHSYNDSRSLSEKESYSNGVTYHNTDSASKQSKLWDAKVRLELEYQIDTLNKLILKPTVSYTDNSYNQYSDYVYRKDTSVVSDGHQTRFSHSGETSATLQAIYSHKFMKAGRSLSLNGEAGLTDTREEGETYALDRRADTATVDQNTRTKSNALNYSIKASYVEPIYGRNHFLEIAAGMAVRNRQSDKKQYAGQDQSRLDSAYSNSFRNDFYSETMEVNYRWVSQYCDLTAGLRVNPSQTRSRTTYMDTEVTQDTTVSVWNFAPNFNFKYKFGKKEFARIIYRGTTQQPSLSQLEPVRNNSEAMNERVGNLDLNPAFSHTLRFMYSKFDQNTFASVMCGLRGTLTKDALVNNSIYDENGKLYQQTVNAGTVPWNIGGDLMFNVPFAKKMLQLHSRTSLSYNQQAAYILREQKASDIAAMIATGTLTRGAESRTGNLRAQENLSLRFTHDIVDIGLKGDFTYSRTDNNMAAREASNVFEWTVTGDVEFHLPKSWSIAADCGYTDRYGYNLNDVSELILNASVTKSWKNASLKLSCFDLLNNKKNIMQVVGENYVQYRKFNTLPTYAMVTFTYKLNKMGSLKATGKAAFMQEMIENGGSNNGRPRTPPAGPPPGM
ncbi:MAG: outer membrane beta-barrel protein [Paludibacteraceae bacterium]|nr:outer membrane beta-barrel protein [Paludibacteraceae bacterium]